MVRPTAMIDSFRHRCAAAGFDLAQCFDTAWCADDASLRLPDFGRNGAFAVVVGNTRRLWPLLVRRLADGPAALDAIDVIDAYAEEQIAAAAAAVGVRWEACWAHVVDGRYVPIQRIAERAGLAWLSPAHLCVHPRFGPWIGLRAVVVFDLPPPTYSPPLSLDPCGSCMSGCAVAFQATGNDWHSWLAVRDACPLGRDHRYSEQQILYHYTKDLEALRRDVQRFKGSGERSHASATPPANSVAEPRRSHRPPEPVERGCASESASQAGEAPCSDGCGSKEAM